MSYPSVNVEDILEECITAIHARGQTVADCLARYPNRRDELEPLLKLAVRLRVARTLEVSPELRRVAAARMRNLIAAQPPRVARSTAVNGSRPQAPRPQPLLARLRWRFMFALAIVVLVVSLLGGGTVYAANEALPGDTLYPVKRTTETIWLTVAPNDPNLHLLLANRRLDEVTVLLEQKRPADIEQVLAEYEAQVDSLLMFLGEQSALSPVERAVLADELLATQARRQAHLATLLEQAPEDVRPAARQALTAAQKTQNEAESIVEERRAESAPPPAATPLAPTVAPATATRRPTATASPIPTSPPSPTAPPPATSRPTAPATVAPPPTATERPAPTERPTPQPAPERPAPTERPAPQPAPAPLPTIEVPAPTAPPEPPTAAPEPPTATQVPPTAPPDVAPTSPPDTWPTLPPEAWPTMPPNIWPTVPPEAWPTMPPEHLAHR